jgi:hypothetical protein
MTHHEYGFSRCGMQTIENKYAQGLKPYIFLLNYRHD